MMETIPLVNVCKFYTRLNAFRVDGEFTDITIECADGGETFKCHRLALAAASDYFRDLFRNTTKECTGQNIVLREVNAVTLQEVLRFIYTGDARIDCDKFWDVFRASKSFRLSGLRDSCISFVMENTDKFTVQNILSMYSHAHGNEDDLVDILRPHLVERLKMISEMSEFLELPFNALSEIIKQRLNAPAQANTDEAVSAAMTRWVRHESSRSEEAHELVTFISSWNIIPEFRERTTTAPLVRDECTPPHSIPDRVLGVGSSPSKALHVYVRFAQEDIIRIFSIDSSTKVWNPTGEIFRYDSDQNFSTAVPLNDNFLYRLHYYGEHGPFPGEDHQTFYACTSANMLTAVPLKRPPIHFENVSLCAIQNNIYAYHETQTSNPFRTRSIPNSRTWNDEEISRGIFTYNGEVDDWFPVPTMRKTVECASTTVLDDTLFIVGGYLNEIGPFNYAQAYDSREGVWQELPQTTGHFLEASACCLHEKIYIFGGFLTRTCERYDPVAGRWECLQGTLNIPALCSKSIVYQHRIWNFNKGPIRWYLDRDATDANRGRRLYFQTGRSRLNADPTLLSFTWSRKSIDMRRENATHFVDSFVFKPYLR